MHFPTLRLLTFPLVLLMVGGGLPAGLMLWQPDLPIFDADLFYWLACFLFLGLALGAVRLTFNSLMPRQPDSSIQASGTPDLIENLRQQSHARSGELLIMGVGLLSLMRREAETSVADWADLLRFVSFRLGATLLLLGVVIMVATHFKMRRS